MEVIAEARADGTLHADVETYALNDGHAAMWRAVNLSATADGVQHFTVLHKRNAEYGRYQVRLAGRHNVLNALAAIDAATYFGVACSVIAAALGEFRGAERRFERKGDANGRTLVDDYGHHPTEIAAVLHAARASGDVGVTALNE